jgi:hypothetical protein
MKKFYKLIGFVLWLALPTMVFATTAFNSAQVGGSASNGYVLQTNGSINTWVATSSLGISGSGTNYWTLSGNQLYPNSTSYNVGIGLTNPNQTIDILGSGAYGINHYPQLQASTSLGNVYVGGANYNTTATGTSNTFVGAGAGSASLTTGGANSIVGAYSFGVDTTGQFNSGIGEYSLIANTTGNVNDFIGQGDLDGNITGNNNMAMGNYALYASNCNSNIGIGVSAGASLTGTGCAGDTFIGTSADVTQAASTTLQYASAIGYGAGVDCSNCMALGGVGTGATREFVGIGLSHPTTALSVLSNDYSSASTTANNGIATFSTSGNTTLSINGTSLSPYAISLQAKYANFSGVSPLVFNPLGGNVGIGTTSPSNALEVNGNGYLNGNLTAANITATGTLSAATLNAIGCASCGYNLRIVNGGTAVINNYNNGTANAALSLQNVSSGILILSGGGGNTIINPSGGFTGIGSSTPSNKLEVNGNTFLGGNVTAMGTISVIGTATITGALTESATATSTFAGSVQVTAGTIVNNEYAPATSTTMTLNWLNGTQQLVKLGHAAVTINFSGVVAGGVLRIPLCQDGTGGATVTWDSRILWAASTTPVLGQANHCDLITLDATAGTSSTIIMGGYLNF